VLTMGHRTLFSAEKEKKEDKANTKRYHFFAHCSFRNYFFQFGEQIKVLVVNWLKFSSFSTRPQNLPQKDILDENLPDFFDIESGQHVFLEHVFIISVCFYLCNQHSESENKQFGIFIFVQISGL
jgi:hypothetical protein